jgi:hypothetical protein
MTTLPAKGSAQEIQQSTSDTAGESAKPAMSHTNARTTQEFPPEFHWHNNRSGDRFQFVGRGPKLSEVELIRKAGADCFPALDERYGDVRQGPSITNPKLGPAGTLLHRKQGDYLVMRGDHGNASRIRTRRVKLEQMHVVKAPKPEYTHEQIDPTA